MVFLSNEIVTFQLRSSAATSVVFLFREENILPNSTIKHQLRFDFRTFQILRKLGIFKAKSSWCFIRDALSRKNTFAMSREFHSTSPRFSLELSLCYLEHYGKVHFQNLQCHQQKYCSPFQRRQFDKIYQEWRDCQMVNCVFMLMSSKIHCSRQSTKTGCENKCLHL